MDGLHCPECAKTHHGFNPEDYDSIDYTNGTYYYGKFVKHTTIPTSSGIVSVFTCSDAASYNRLLIASIYSGSVCVTRGKVDYALWFVSDYLGDTYINQHPTNHCFENKVVKLHDITRTHCYCTNSISTNRTFCVHCNKMIEY